MDTSTNYFDLFVIFSIVVIGLTLIFLFYYFITFKRCIMGKIEDLQAALDEQAEKIAAEKEQVVAILQEQNDNIAALEEQLANGGTPEQLQELIDKVKANTNALVKIYEVPGEEEEQGPGNEE